MDVGSFEYFGVSGCLGYSAEGVWEFRRQRLFFVKKIKKWFELKMVLLIVKPKRGDYSECVRHQSCKFMFHRTERGGGLGGLPE